MMKQQIVDCLKNNEKPHELFTMGVSFGHFLVYARDLSAVAYDGDDGIESLLEYMVRNDWEGIYEEDNLIGVTKYPATVLLQAGGQIELQIAKTASLQVIDRAYLDFIQGLFDELEERKQVLVAFGYQPVTKAQDIPLIPMSKYQYLTQFAAEDEKTLQLLKGSSRITVTIDYAHSDDFEKKIRVATVFAPILDALFDNAPILEGQDYDGFVANRTLMNDTGALFNYIGAILGEGGFKYERYAYNILNSPAIAIADNEEIQYVGDQTVESVFGERSVSQDEVIGVLNMLNTEVRATEQGLELKLVDSVPYPLNMAYVALIKGSLYSGDNLNALYDLASTFSEEDLAQLRLDVMEKGLEAKFGEGTALDALKDMFFMATPQLLPNEQHYTQPLDAVIFKNILPKKIAKRQIDGLKK